MPKGRIPLYIALLVLLTISLAYHVREFMNVGALLSSQGHVGDPFEVDFPGTGIESVKPEAEAAGLHRGDQIVAIAGRPYRGSVDFYTRIVNAHPGDRLELQVRSSDGIKNISVRLEIAQALTARDLAFIVVGSPLPLFCIGLGFWVASVRIRDPIAWIFLGLMISFGETVGTTSAGALFGHDDLLQPLLAGYQQFSANIWSVFMLLFGIYFPQRIGFDRRWPWLKWILAAPILVRATQYGISGALAGTHVAAAIAVSQFIQIGKADPVMHVILIASFFPLIGYKAFSAGSSDARRRVLLLCYGVAISVTPAIIVILINAMRGAALIGVSPVDTAVFFLLMIGFPVTIAYVIVIQRAMDVRVVVRQGLQYVLASKGVAVIQVLLSAVIVFIATTGGENMNRPQRFALILAGLGCVFALERFASNVRTWIDRRFFREAYDAEQLLTDLAEKVRTIVETGPLLETVAHRISESLHITRLAVLLNGGDTFHVAYALGDSGGPATMIPADADLESTARKQFDAELVLPLKMNQKTLGLITLGPKRSEEPYSTADLRLLGSVATQTGLALENSRLTAEVAQEVAQRERLNREIEIAREVQERLFPQELPAIRGFDYAGSCRPALGVGGDYYDFLDLPDGKLGIAIGDVSGKGIPAALLMAGLRASLRGQTIQGSSDLAALITNVNKLVYESSSSNRYATFFYGQFDPVTRCLTYVNAGHNPPLIFRKPDQLIRLEAGGAVVGLLPMFTYEQATITLEPGDRFVAFTDGISEAMNKSDEEWGEERLIEAAWRLDSNTSAAECMTSLVASADAFAAGAKQHDDMTIIVARVTAQS